MENASRGRRPWGDQQAGSGSVAFPHAIQHNIFSGNMAASGGGLALTSGPVSSTVTNNAFLDNTATGNGAAYLLSIRDCV
jgi:hypothetical protein